jgi:membrane protease YdiL (CAAX protease family)
VLGAMAFQLFLSGTSEELLFRAFPITLLSILVSKTFRLFNDRVSVPLSVIIAVVTFSLAHINWSLDPFRLQYDILQLLYALAMGIVQGWAYVITRSVLYPMVMHGISNVLVTGISIVMPVLF